MSNQASSDKILFLLKTKGPLTVKALSQALNMTTMGARQHLLQLQEQGLVSHYNRAEKVGRPSQYWQLTSQSHMYFPDSHSQLTVSMLNAVETVFGELGLDKLIRQRERDCLQDYQAQLAAFTSLHEKIEQLVAIRDSEGYMATFEQDESGHYWLFENHCPICAAAQSCQDFCRSELSMFRACLSGLANVHREEHILEGARRCAYKIIPIV